MTQAYSDTESTDSHQQHQFSCQACGAAIVYQVGTKQLHCLSCGHHESIDDKADSINEIPLTQALENLRLKPLAISPQTVSCQRCGGSSEWDIYSLSDLCPYCKTPIAKLDTDSQRLQIEAIVPFALEKSQAFNLFSQWIKKRWFAPNVLKQMAGHSKQFDGIYVPHWTFDSLTYTNYRGLRGDNYTEYVRQTRVVNGKRQTVTVPVTRTRWHAVSGQVRVVFDDVLVLASMLVPKTIVKRLSPWRLEQAEPYTPEYLAGLKAQYYQLDLDEAFIIAKQKMAQHIELKIRQDIGGDHQRIKQKQTRYQNSTYKLILLPVWHSSFEYKGKIYQTVVNGQSGKVQGHYPKSPIKIAFAVIAALVVLAVVGYFYVQKSL